MAFSAPTEEPHPIAKYRFLGRTGLRVSPLCLGTMNFGTNWTSFMGECSKEEAERIFERYISLGGNFIDTANKYQEGQSEEWLGEWIEKRGIRDDLVIATKFSLPMKKGSINSAGNTRKNMFQSLEASLRRLRTTYIDIFYVHFWDFTAPIEEVMRALDDLVRSGKVHYIGVSDTPAWIVARGNTIAELRGWTQFSVYQGKHHLGERDMERDIIPMSRTLGLSVVPWAVLGQGKFTGKYRKGQPKSEEATRGGVEMSDKDLDIAEEVIKIAEEIGRSPSQVALNWSLRTPGITSPLIGCRKVEQLEDNLAALEFKLTEEQVQRLNDVAKVDLGFPHTFTGTSYQTCPWIKAAGFLE